MSTSTTAIPRCPACNAPCDAGNARFCADCGASLTGGPRPEPPAAVAPQAAPGSAACGCGSTRFDADGFCENCGTRRRSQSHADEGELGPGLAAATHVGMRHTRNDDAFALDGPPGGGVGTILVVCDGVTNSQLPNLASAAAAQAACGRLRAGLAAAEPVEAAMAAAIRDAHAAACAVPFDPEHPLDPPAATIAAAVVQAGGHPGQRRVTVGWLGDSRIYWLAPQGRPLTRDHSWRNMVVDSGEMTDEAARQDRRAHAIVHCLGTSDLHGISACPAPAVATHDLPAEGWLLGCSDGLWNYAEGAQDILAQADLSSALAGCRSLIAFANRAGGVDNITVALALLA